MARSEQLKIGDVVARTGLTERAIRHYERLGLIKPDRSAAGQRLFGADALRALASVRILKRAGFSLGEIEALLAAKVEAKTLIKAQIESLKAQAQSVQSSLTLLQGIAREIERGGGADVDVLCRLVEAGEHCEQDESWRKIFDKYFSPARQRAWVKMQERLRAAVDPQEHEKAWWAIAADIRAALPLDPTSAKAQALLDRWNALLEPFNRVATETQKREARSFWLNVGDWGQNVNQPMTREVVEFIKAAREARERTSKQGKKGPKK
jgi:MerR family transcriptional regulator, thiopeptide resistance regulator